VTIVPMNQNHADLCPSPEWAAHLHRDVLPALAESLELGPRMLEIGPGPGAGTEWLRHRVDRLVVIELEEETVAALEKRFHDTNVEVRQGDATGLSFEDDSFDSVGCFTMLHHVPTAALQNQLLAEALRVLRPGGTMIASDSLPSSDLHDFHLGDVYNPVDPASLLTRLQTVGFGAVTISVDHGFTFRARKPDPARDGIWDHDA
jgi:ubiquinone/menaquinone biosynthesis C-methylase UbiE